MSSIINLEVILTVESIHLEEGNSYAALKCQYSDSVFKLGLPEDIARTVQINEAFFLVSIDRRIPQIGEIRWNGIDPKPQIFDGKQWNEPDNAGTCAGWQGVTHA